MNKFHWSFSTYDSYQTCPRRLNEIRFAKTVVEPESPHAQWGTEVHKALELGVKESTPLPASMEHLNSIIDTLKKTPGKVYTECQLAVSRDLDPVEFFSELVWCRGIVDFLAVNHGVAIALDYKTGKRKLTKQLELMALLIFANFNSVEKVHTGFVWLKEGGKLDTDTFRRDQIPELWDSFRKTVNDMEYSFEMGLWPERQNGLCRQWCPVVQCKYNGKRN